MRGVSSIDVDVMPEPLAAGACTCKHDAHSCTSHCTGTLSWKQHGYVARAKVDKQNRKTVAKRKVVHVARDLRGDLECNIGRVMHAV